jgi:hypothetical protein
MQLRDRWCVKEIRSLPTVHHLRQAILSTSTTSKAAEETARDHPAEHWKYRQGLDSKGYKFTQIYELLKVTMGRRKPCPIGRVPHLIYCTLLFQSRDHHNLSLSKPFLNERLPSHVSRIQFTFPILSLILCCIDRLLYSFLFPRPGPKDGF